MIETIKYHKNYSCTYESQYGCQWYCNYLFIRKGFGVMYVSSRTYLGLTLNVHQFEYYFKLAKNYKIVLLMI
jgi:hypothetical protein